MNANELADVFKSDVFKIGHSITSYHLKLLEEAATMLRQQQAQIEALKVRLNPYQSITDTKIEPTVVSYTHPVTEHFEDEPQAEELHEILQSNVELTDEEILISAQYNGIRASEILDEYVIDFARAILRKAQEK
jgi:hypothetical protein